MFVESKKEKLDKEKRLKCLIDPDKKRNAIY